MNTSGQSNLSFYPNQNVQTDAEQANANVHEQIQASYGPPQARIGNTFQTQAEQVDGRKGGRENRLLSDSDFHMSQNAYSPYVTANERSMVKRQDSTDDIDRYDNTGSEMEMEFRSNAFRR